MLVKKSKLHFKDTPDTYEIEWHLDEGTENLELKTDGAPEEVVNQMLEDASRYVNIWNLNETFLDSLPGRIKSAEIGDNYLARGFFEDYPESDEPSPPAPGDVII